MTTERSQLIWRCRRGIREMDIVLQEFLNTDYEALDETNKQIFVALLDEADLDILNWLMGKSEPDSEDFKNLITLIRQSRNLN